MYYDDAHLCSEHPLPALLARDPTLEKSSALCAVRVSKSKLIRGFIHKGSKPLYDLLRLHQHPRSASAMPVKVSIHECSADNVSEASVLASAMVALRPHPPKLVTLLSA